MAGSITATTAIAATGLALSAAGTGVSVMGALQNASAQKASADYQAQVAAGNAKIATQNANFASESGEQQAAIQEQKTRSQVGAIEAAQGSSGVDINSPTATAVRTSQGELGALDAQTIRSNAARTAYGYQTQSTNSAGAGLLSGVGNASLNYAKVIGNSSGIDTSNSVNISDSNAVGAGGMSGNG